MRMMQIKAKGSLLARVFRSRFARGCFNPLSRQSRMVGVSIRRSIIESHGGQMSAGDNRDGGASFRFTMPASAPISKAVDPDQSGRLRSEHNDADHAQPFMGSTMTSATAPPKIFVVDDDDNVRESIKILLEIHGLEVEDFGSTSDFVSHCHKPLHGCLILDQHLPRTTGLDFLTSHEGKELGIPVILITGQGDPALERRAREAGVAEYLQKPMGNGLLLETVERVIAAAEARASARQPR
jgi:two-component system response regulator FixJ